MLKASSLNNRVGPIGLDIMKFIEWWNNKYPYDFYWRKKYNVPFGSPQHLNTSHIHMVFDLNEEEVIRKIVQNVRRKDVDMMLKTDTYDALLPYEIDSVKEDTFGKKVIDMSQSEIDETFSTLDLTQFNDKNINITEDGREENTDIG